MEDFLGDANISDVILNSFRSGKSRKYSRQRLKKGSRDGNEIGSILWRGLIDSTEPLDCKFKSEVTWNPVMGLLNCHS